MKCILILFTFIAFSISGEQPSAIKRLDGSTIKPAEIDASVNRLIKAAEITGIGLAIFNDGHIAYLKTYGVRDKEKNLPLTVDTVMSAVLFLKSRSLI